jgi:hypothetical protein
LHPYKDRAKFLNFQISKNDFCHFWQIQPPSAIFLLGIKLARKTSLGVLNLRVFRGRLFNKEKEMVEGCTFNSCAISLCVLLQDNRV